MQRLQLVVYPRRDVLFGWKQIGDKLGEEDAMLLPELFYEANQGASERAKDGGRRTILLQLTPVNLHVHVVVAPGIAGMRQEVAPV